MTRKLKIKGDKPNRLDLDQLQAEVEAQWPGASVNFIEDATVTISNDPPVFEYQEAEFEIDGLPDGVEEKDVRNLLKAHVGSKTKEEKMNENFANRLIEQLQLFNAEQRLWLKDFIAGL